MRFWAPVLLLIVLTACAEVHEQPLIGDESIRITFLHTSDMHGRLLPYRMQVTYTDNTLGLSQENEPFGGIARVGHIVNRERARADRVLYIDSGDVFQGAPIFNVFKGEAGFRALSYLNPDAMAVGNHEFDNGLENLIVQTRNWVTFPFLAANYYFMPSNPLGELVQPYTIVNAKGVKIALIGLGDFSSMTSITDIGNSLGIMPMNNDQVVQDTVAALRPLVDLVVLVSHAGLSHDQEVIEATSGVDLVFGGHLHIVLNPPKVMQNADGEDVILVHSGAFAKYVGRLDVVARRNADGEMKVESHSYELFPVDATVPEDPKLAQLMEEYTLKLNQTIDLTSVYGYSPKLLTKYGYEGGDSALGNLVSEAIRKYARVDVAFTNTLGIRANMYPGPITLDDLYNIFPFDNTITLMYLSGSDIRELLDYVARRSSGRGCVSQLQVSGLEFVMNCSPDPPAYFMSCHDCATTDEEGNVVEAHVEGCLRDCLDGCTQGDRACLADCIDVKYRGCVMARSETAEDAICLNHCLPIGSQDQDFSGMRECLMDCFPRAESIVLTDCPNPMLVEDESTCKYRPMVDTAMYEVATNDYIARGGSGFYMLKSNNTQTDTGLPLRDAVQEVIMTSDSCLNYCLDRDGVVDLQSCSVYQGCLEKVSTFYEGFCARVDKTGGADLTGELRGCAEDSGACYRESDCYFPDLDCVGGNECTTCTTSSECLAQDPNSICVANRCVQRTHSCYNGRCVRICETDEDCPGVVPEGQASCIKGRCEPVPSISCDSNQECVDPYLSCFGGGDLCGEDKDCADGFECRNLICVPHRVACAQDSECSGGVCVFGWCQSERIACANNTDCGASGECLEGVCTLPCGSCSADSQCPDGLSCVKGFCLALRSHCLSHRCRTDCSLDGDCKSGEVCDGGACMPRLCVEETLGETLCGLNARFKAEQTCVNVPCVDSRVDGRIGRILPENLGELDFGFVPNDPEDLDEY